MPITIILYHPPVSSSPFATFVPELRQMINTAFDSQDRSIYGPDELFPGQVLQTDEDLQHGYGPVGLAAVAFDTYTDPNGETKQIPVATAGIKPWKGKEVDAWLEFMAGTSRQNDELLDFKTQLRKKNPAEKSGPIDWSLVLVASRNDPKYRAKGLVSQCIALLEQYLVDARRTAVENGTAGSEEPIPIPIWLTALGGIGNVEYYEKRGFVLQALDDAPKGMWGSTGAFKVATMRKVL